MMLGKEEIMESGGSGSELQLEEKSVNETQEAGDQLSQPNGSKKKRYHRHTARQIQEMEALFKECPHPDDKQRMRLSQELGLRPRQVKFWFQNRRTQMKAHQDRSENVILRAENDNLKNENCRLQAALGNIMCPSCGGQAMLRELALDEIRMENARLKEELERVCCMVPRYGGPPAGGAAAASLLQPTPNMDTNTNPNNTSIYSSGQQHCHEDPSKVTTSCSELEPVVLPSDGQPRPPHPIECGGRIVLVEEEKYPLALDLALSSVDELVKMCQLTEPLWVTGSGDKYSIPRAAETLDFAEHARLFPCHHSKPVPEASFVREASRDSAVIIMNSITLVDAFLHANKWMDLFPSIVSRAKTIQIISPGMHGHTSGSLQLMYAELQMLSPLVPTREAYFLRYFHQDADDGKWAIVDFPIDSFHETLPPSFPRYRRRPSGCLVEDMPNGYSRITWVEHAEMEKKPVHSVFDRFTCSDIAFGAPRWLAVLQRQSERIASLMARNIPDLGVIPSPEARRNLMRLAQRMIRTFCTNMSTSGDQSWTALSDSGDDTVRITSRKVLEPGQPNGVILAAASTTWLPYPHYQVFDLLKDERRRSQLDLLSNGSSLHEVAHMANGSHPGNCVSLLRVNVSSNSSQHVELMLQESCTDHSGSLVVYSTIDVDSVQLAMNGEDPSRIPLLPIGFSIVPAACPESNGQDSLVSGCLLTVGLQVLASTTPTAKLNLSSITAINNHICNAVRQISAVLYNGSLNCSTDIIVPVAGLPSEPSGSPGR
ncbi:hypothetical protein SAY86_029679 [Trapa natans]|uniref:Uncharacterized protein n=1 Tax=Trapa natans TaxID=22666 RepID=A0AAN7LWR9_TRANT|nr:hypothetical protein SAY86_029679 [Trapa natans]